MELWKTIAEAPRYEVSDKGRVRNKKTTRILKAAPNKQGTPKVDLRDAGFTITRSVRALQERAFG